MRYHQKKILKMAAVLALFLSAFAGTVTVKADDSSIFSDYNDPSKTIAVELGTITERAAREAIPNAKYIYVNSSSEGFLAVQDGIADGYAAARSAYNAAINSGLTGVTVLNGKLSEDGEIAVGISPNAQFDDAKTLIDDFISDLDQQGILDDITKRWVENSDYTMPEIDAPANPTRTIRIGTTGLIEPYTFYEGDQLTGADIELIKRLALYANANIEISTYDWNGLIPACTSGKVDYVVSNLMVTDERKEVIQFSQPYAKIETVLAVKEKDTSVNTGAKYSQFSDFNGASIGMQTGTVFDKIVSQHVNDVTFKYFDDLSGSVTALKSGDVDAIAVDEPAGNLIAANNSDLALFPTLVDNSDYGLALKKNSSLTQPFSEVIQKYASDGTLTKLKEKWMSGDETKMVIDWSQYENFDAPNGTLNYAIDSTIVPMSYVDGNGKSAGYEVELTLMIAKELGYKLNIIQTSFSALIPSLVSNKADICSGAITITSERKESVDFTTSYYSGGICLMCRKADLTASTSSITKSNFFDSISSSFYKTFIRENRWKLIVSGLLVTLRISIFAALFGTILGFLMCLGHRSKLKVLSHIIGAFIKIIEGIPLIVLLMVLFYIVFASSGMNGEVIAVIGFSINFAAYVSEMMNSGIEAVDPGQMEAAETLGYTYTGAFVRIVAPQALHHIMPIYQGELVSMIKMTSVVGYIAIQDLTKASDIIRSRTYEAFFPLIATAVIYFFLSWGMTAIVGRIEFRTDPKKRKVKLKGVDMSKTPSEIEVRHHTVDPTKELIHIEHMKKCFGPSTTLKDVNASVYDGDVVTIIGPSGTGKSTLLRCINHLETPTDGKILVFDQDTNAKETDLAKLRQRMGMVFQNFNLFPHLTVIENIMIAPMDLKKVPAQQAYENGIRLLNSVGLGQKALSYPDALSGGQKQRVAIARTLAMDPEMILFDEPTSALDPTMISEVLTVIRNLVQQGLTMMIVTHEMKFARDVSTRIFYMDQGIIYEEGTPEQIFDHPQKDRTRQFVNRLKVFHYAITDRRYDFVELIAKIDAFGHHESMSMNKIYDLQMLIEEACTQTILPQIEGEPHLEIMIEYSEDRGYAEVEITYEGKKAAYLDDASVMSKALINEVAHDIKYSYEDKNKYHFVMR